MSLQNYETVAQRLQRFWQDHADGRIKTELLEAGANYWIFKAQVFFEYASVEPIATGHAHETIGASQINKTSALEVCETSAVGRALALCGYHGSGIASTEEITRAKVRASEPAPTLIPNSGRSTAPATKATGSVTQISSKQYIKLISDAQDITDLMKVAEIIANDKDLEDFQKDLLRGNWASRRSAIELSSPSKI